MKNNYRKLLCKNKIENNICNFNNKCIFAHNLKEQIVDNDRKLAYEIIKGNISNINFLDNLNVLENLKILCKTCTKCEKGVCVGGYNCNMGAINKSHTICYNDLMFGNCNGCKNLHITNHGIIPYSKQSNKYNNDLINIYINTPKNITSSDESNSDSDYGSIFD